MGSKIRSRTKRKTFNSCQPKSLLPDTDLKESKRVWRREIITGILLLPVVLKDFDVSYTHYRVERRFQWCANKIWYHLLEINFNRSRMDERWLLRYRQMMKMKVNNYAISLLYDATYCICETKHHLYFPNEVFYF